MSIQPRRMYSRGDEAAHISESMQGAVVERASKPHVQDKPYIPKKEKDFFAGMRDAEGKLIIYEGRPILSLASVSGEESETIELIDGNLEIVCIPDNKGMRIQRRQ